MVILGGWVFLMSEVPRWDHPTMGVSPFVRATLVSRVLKGEVRGTHPPLQGYLVHKEPEFSKRSVSVSYLGGPIKKLSENARCPFLTY